MKKKLPAVALIWMYQGKDVEARRKRISELDYSNYEVIQVREGHGWSRAAKAVSASTELCIFWIDDDKPVGNDFIKRMVAGATMHFWSGNAFCVPKSLLDLCPPGDEAVPSSSLLKLLLPVLDVAEKEPNGRVHIAFSSTERLAPLAMDAVGVVM